MLQRLWADGLSASQIAGELGGVTRNGVIGKLHRLGLANSRPHRPIRTSDDINAQRRVRRMRTQRQRFRERLPDPEEQAVIDLPANQSPDAIPFMQAGDGQCRWPLGEPTHQMMVCGARQLPECPYCARHARIAYRSAA
jgi:GcrA cell cycle regulator